MEKIYNHQEFKDFMNGRGLGMIWADSKGLAKFYAEQDESIGKVLNAVGLAK